MDSEINNEHRGGGRAYRSRLESFVDFIRAQRQQRKTWQEIAALLQTEKGCTITFQGLHQFYRRYLKRQTRHHWEADTATAQPVVTKSYAPTHKSVVASTPAPRSFRRPSPEDIKLNDPTKI